MGGAREVAQLGAAINTMAEALREQATVDALTGLYNARHFKAELPAMLEDAARDGTPLALLNIDVNDLKPINDTHGHHAGDLAAPGDRWLSPRVGGRRRRVLAHRW